jgi:hypothetical protein
MRTQQHSESGQATIEFAGMIGLLLIAALFAWQMALVGWTVVSANNAARTAARTASRGGDGKSAGMKSLSGKGLESHASVTMQGTRAVVTVDIPTVLPGLTVLKLPITETADMPFTG